MDRVLLGFVVSPIMTLPYFALVLEKTPLNPTKPEPFGCGEISKFLSILCCQEVIHQNGMLIQNWQSKQDMWSWNAYYWRLQCFPWFNTLITLSLPALDLIIYKGYGKAEPKYSKHFVVLVDLPRF